MTVAKLHMQLLALQSADRMVARIEAKSGKGAREARKLERSAKRATAEARRARGELSQFHQRLGMTSGTGGAAYGYSKSIGLYQTGFAGRGGLESLSAGVTQGLAVYGGLNAAIEQARSGGPFGVVAALAPLVGTAVGGVPGALIGAVLGQVMGQVDRVISEKLDDFERVRVALMIKELRREFRSELALFSDRMEDPEWLATARANVAGVLRANRGDVAAEAHGYGRSALLQEAF